MGATMVDLTAGFHWIKMEKIVLSLSQNECKAALIFYMKELCFGENVHKMCVFILEKHEKYS